MHTHTYIDTELWIKPKDDTVKMSNNKEPEGSRKTKANAQEMLKHQRRNTQWNPLIRT